jgi:hypothetical protein
VTGDHSADFLELRQILYWSWDPIGVRDAFPCNATEYDRYVDELLPRLEAGGGPDDVAAYLIEVERDEISVGRGPDPAREVAEAVTSWFGCRQGDRNEARRPVPRG